MLSLEYVTSFMYEHFENVSISKNGIQFLARCPLCGDSKKSKRKRRFNLKYDGNNTVFRCFNCNESGNFKKLYYLITNERYKEYDYKNFDGVKERLKFKKEKVKQKVKRLKSERRVYNNIINDCIGLDDEVNSSILKWYKDVLESFYKDRCISKNYKIYISFYGNYKDRIIIPIYDGDDIVYFQARRIFKEMEPKYTNPPFEKNSIILNKSNFENDKYIVVTEGILDAYSVGNQGTSCLGKEVDKEFLNELLKFTNVGVIIAFDSDKDGIKSLKKHYESVFKYFHNINLKYFLIPKIYRKYKDINKLKVKLKIENMYEFVVKNSYSYEGYVVRI